MIDGKLLTRSAVQRVDGPGWRWYSEIMYPGGDGLERRVRTADKASCPFTIYEAGDSLTGLVPGRYDE
jgi:hypothetical protein